MKLEKRRESSSDDVSTRVETAFQELLNVRHEGLKESAGNNFGQINSPLVYKFKILVSFLQVTTNITSIVDVSWPRTYNAFLDMFDFVNMSFLPWNTLSCIDAIDYYTKMQIYTLTPIVILLGVVAMYALPNIYKANKKAKKAALTSGVVLAQVRLRLNLLRISQRSWKLIILTMFLVFPSVCAQLASFFFCVEVDSIHYLKSDLTLICYGEEWTNFLPFVICMILVYPVGIPLLLFFRVLHKRETLDSAEVKLELGFLYESFHRRMWWFEITDLGYKIFMTCVVGLLDPEWQLPVAMCAVFVYLVSILLWTPYRRWSDDQLQVLCLLETMLMLQCGFVIYDLDSPYGLPDVTDAVLSAYLILVSVVLVSSSILFLLHHLTSRIMKGRRPDDLHSVMRFCIDCIAVPTGAFAKYIHTMDNRGARLLAEFGKQDEKSRNRSKMAFSARNYQKFPALLDAGHIQNEMRIVRNRLIVAQDKADYYEQFAGVILELSQLRTNRSNQ
jgi:hypothetical protein